MLNIGIIGIGNTGNQIASLGKERLNIPVLAINSSDRDLETVPKDIPRKLIVTNDTDKQGAGKDRKLAKKYLKSSVTNLIEDEDVVGLMDSVDVVFIISSTGGGTGSGISPIMARIMADKFVDTKVILVGVLPVNGEMLSAHANTLEYLDELNTKLPDQTYMLYDNDKYDGLMSSYKILEQVNNDIISDLDVLRCTYNYTTKYNSIDDRDMMRLISFSGRLIVARLEDFKEKDADTVTIEDMLIDRLKRNSHVEFQRDKKIMGSGLITNLSQPLMDEFDDNIPKVVDFIGDAIHGFIHEYVTADRKEPNNVFLILAGLSPINDKILKINDRIAEIEKNQQVLLDDNAIDKENLNALSNKIADTDTVKSEKSVNIQDIFADFDS